MCGLVPGISESDLRHFGAIKSAYFLFVFDLDIFVWQVHSFALGFALIFSSVLMFASFSQAVKKRRDAPLQVLLNAACVTMQQSFRAVA